MVTEVAFRGKLDFCSNFYPCSISYQGITFSTSEHAFQYAKCKDEKSQHLIRSAETAAESKAIGAKAILIDYWDDVRVGVMYDILKSKFKNNPSLAKRLLETNDEYLEETNYWNDKFWGVCRGEGKNWLGKLLMGIRNELQEGVK